MPVKTVYKSIAIPYIDEVIIIPNGHMWFQIGGDYLHQLMLHKHAVSNICWATVLIEMLCDSESQHIMITNDSKKYMYTYFSYTCTWLSAITI